MLLAIYILTLGLSSGVVGAFVHHVLANYGYALGFQVGVFLAGGAGALYASLELGYMTAVSLLKPPKGGKWLFAESLSHGAVVLLIPYVMNVAVPWPHPLFFRVEPLVYLAFFLAAHGFLKTLSFFAALYSEPASRLGALGWLAAWAASSAAALWMLTAWTQQFDTAHPRAPDITGVYRAGNEYASARVLPEGAVAEYEISGTVDRCLTLRWANLPELRQTEPLERLYVTITLDGETSKAHSTSIRLRSGGWATLRVPSHQIPARSRVCSIRWTSQAPPPWQHLTGFQPVIRSDRQVLLAGPYEHLERASQEGLPEAEFGAPVLGEGPSIVLIAVQGLGRGHMSPSDRRRSRVPALDRFAATSLRFENTFTTAPDAAAACMTMLTGLYPLHHGYLGSHSGPLPEGVRTLAELLRDRGYATAAFTEGEAVGDLAFGSGFEQGFEVFDPSYRSEREPLSEGDGDGGEFFGSRATLENARRWIDQHQNVLFMVFIRLQELRAFEDRARWALARSPSGVVPTPRADRSVEEAFNASLARLDQEVGAFIRHLREHEIRENTVIVVTSPYGLDVSRTASPLPLLGISEESLRVPGIIHVPGLNSRVREDFIGLEDLAPSLLTLTEAAFPNPVDGRDFLGGPNGNKPVSMTGDPLVVSMRSAQWRLVWNTGRRPFRPVRAGQADRPQLYDVQRSLRYGWSRDEAPRQSELVARWQEALEKLLETHDRFWAQQPQQP